MDSGFSGTMGHSPLSHDDIARICSMLNLRFGMVWGFGARRFLFRPKIGAVTPWKIHVLKPKNGGLGSMIFLLQLGGLNFWGNPARSFSVEICCKTTMGPAGPEPWTTGIRWVLFSHLQEVSADLLRRC